jgi:periplasmic protein TonB
MDARHSTPVSFDDIVFEGRNKAYGAYQLRLEYPQRMRQACGISLSGMLLLFGLGYGAMQLKPQLVEQILPKDHGRVVQLMEDPIFEKTAKVEPVLEKAFEPAAAATTPATATEQFIKPRIVPNDVEVKVEMPSQAAFAEADPGLVTAAGVPSEGTAGTPQASGTGTGTGEGTGAATEVFISVEQMPEYVEGGEAGMMKFISRNLRYPRGASEEGLQGLVVVSFVVSASGEVSNITVLKDLGGGTGEEAMRVVAKMPRWRPGIQNHRQVPVRMTLPIRFQLGS